MKLAILIVLLFIGGLTSAQELNIGLELAGGPESINSTVFSLGPTIEYRLKESRISFNSGVLFLFSKYGALLTFPVNIKFIIGNKFRICPTTGGFIRSNKNYGWTLGLELDYKIKNRLIIFVKGDFNRDYYKVEIPNHFGENSETTNSESSFWFGLGIKINIL